MEYLISDSREWTTFSLIGGGGGWRSTQGEGTAIWKRRECPYISNPYRMLISTCRVRTGPGKPGKSWNFVVAFSRTGKSWKKATGPGKSWKSVKLN